MPAGIVIMDTIVHSLSCRFLHLQVIPAEILTFHRSKKKLVLSLKRK